MKLLQLELSKIKTYQRNNKDHPQSQVELIAQSITECWFNAPIIVDEKNVILAWHGRFLASKHLWLKLVPIIKHFNLNKEQKQKYRLFDNKLADLWEYNKENIKLELEELNDPILNELFNDLNLKLFEEELDIDNQDVAPIPQDNEPIVQKWDLFQLWNHFLLCWDATNVDDYNILVQWSEMDMVFTDPPYNINYKWSWKKTSNKIKNDNMDQNSFYNFLNLSFKSLTSITSNNTPWYIFHSHKTQKIFEQTLNDNNIKVISQLIWNKPSVNHVGWDYKQKHEPFFYASDWDPAFYWDLYNATVIDFEKTDEQILRSIKLFREAEKSWKTTIWSMKRHNVQDYEHPTQKPVDLVISALNNSSKMWSRIIDSFGWSWTTLIACERNNRICYMMELDPKYIEVIIRRYADFTRNNRAIKCLNRQINIKNVLDNV